MSSTLRELCLGIACWGAALAVFAVNRLPWPWVCLALQFLLLPALWGFCAVKLWRGGRGRWLAHWWVWPSLLVLLLPWALMGRFLLGVFNYEP